MYRRQLKSKARMFGAGKVQGRKSLPFFLLYNELFLSLSFQLSVRNVLMCLTTVSFPQLHLPVTASPHPAPLITKQFTWKLAWHVNRPTSMTLLECVAGTPTAGPFFHCLILPIYFFCFPDPVKAMKGNKSPSYWRQVYAFMVTVFSHLYLLTRPNRMWIGAFGNSAGMAESLRKVKYMWLLWRVFYLNRTSEVIWSCFARPYVSCTYLDMKCLQIRIICSNLSSTVQL